MKRALFFVFALFLSGCVVTSKTELVTNDTATLMFDGQPRLMWEQGDKQRISLELLPGDKNRTYLARNLSEPDEPIEVRFQKWPDFEVLTKEGTYVLAALIPDGEKKDVWYYQLLTHDETRDLWSIWNYSTPNSKELEVHSIEELKKTFSDIIKNKKFERATLDRFTVYEGDSGEKPH